MVLDLDMGRRAQNLLKFWKFWTSPNITRVLASIADGANYSQKIARRTGMSQSLAHSYIRILVKMKLLEHGERQGIIQTYKINYVELWRSIKNIVVGSVISMKTTNKKTKNFEKLDELVKNNLDEFSAFINRLLINYERKSLSSIFSEDMFYIIDLWQHAKKKPKLIHAYGEIKNLGKIFTLLRSLVDIEPNHFVYTQIFETIP